MSKWLIAAMINALAGRRGDAPGSNAMVLVAVDRSRYYRVTTKTMGWLHCSKDALTGGEDGKEEGVQMLKVVYLCR